MRNSPLRITNLAERTLFGFKAIATVFLLALLVTGGLEEATLAVPQAQESIVEAGVWRLLGEAADHQATFIVALHVPPDQGPAAAIDAQIVLEGPLEELQRAGSISAFTPFFGANAIVVTGSRSAVLFLAGQPNVATIRSYPSGEAWQTTFRVNAVAATGQITGQVTGPDGTTPLAGITVTAYRQVDPISWLVAGTVSTDATGAYTIGGLPTAIYRARFRDPSGDYVGEFYDDKRTFTLATNFDVTDGQTTAGISASLNQAGRIAGVVTKLSDGSPVVDIAVGAWYFDGLAWVNAGGGVTNSGGDYVIGGLAPGAYRIKFDDVYSPPRYVPEYYDNVLTIGDATGVEVIAGVTTPAIDATLSGYGKISGMVTGPGGTIAIQGIIGLGTGDYRVEFSDPVGQLAAEFYDDKADLESATDVGVILGVTTPGIDASLDLAVMSVGLPLVADWNLISLSLSPNDPAPGVVLSPIDGDYERIWAYDGCDSADPWKLFDPDIPVSDLDALGEKQGYWLLVTSPATLTVSGMRPLVTTIPLCEGWNLIGYPSGSSDKIGDALAEIEGKYDLVYGYKAAQPSDPWKKYDPNAPFGNDLKSLEPGFGYWIRMTVPATLAVPGR
jgi:hypothetical protein